MRTAVAPPTEPAAAAAAAPRQLAACSSAMIPISRLKIINLRDRHIASEQRVMVKKRKYIKSGKFSKKIKGLETESFPIYKRDRQLPSSAAVATAPVLQDAKNEANNWSCKMYRVSLQLFVSNMTARAGAR